MDRRGYKGAQRVLEILITEIIQYVYSQNIFYMHLDKHILYKLVLLFPYFCTDKVLFVMLT